MNKFIENYSGNILADKNYVLKMPDFYLSYNPNTGSKITCFAGDGGVGSAETALVKDDCFYILNGDFRSEYEGLVNKGFEACYEFYLSKPELKSSWSN